MKLNIDLQAIGHRLARWWWANVANRSGEPYPGWCSGCGKPLSFKECTIYLTECERCAALGQQQRAAAGAGGPPVPCPSLGPCTWPDCIHFLEVQRAVGLSPPALVESLQAKALRDPPEVIADEFERMVRRATDRLLRCSLGCAKFGQCRAAMHGVPSECVAGAGGPQG